MFWTIVISALAGILGTGIGAFIGACLGVRSEKVMRFVLAFAAGVMLSLVCFELVPESLEAGQLWLTVLSLFVGMLFVFLLNRIVDFFASRQSQKKLLTLDDAEKKYSFRMLKAGIVMLVAISLHNLPEGMALGAGGILNMRFSVVLAVLIALHNLPDGMAIATALTVGGMKRWKAVLLPALTGVVTVVGAILGFILGNLSPIATSIAMAISGGTLLYVIFYEILPESMEGDKEKYTILFTLFGILLGLTLSVMG